MSRPRKRAVRLTADALELMQKALGKRWKAQGRTGRMTREARAEMMGVSVVTAGRILKREGVDRSTLELAFGEVGLSWNDDFCEAMPLLGEAPSVEETQAEEAFAEVIEVEPAVVETVLEPTPQPEPTPEPAPRLVVVTGDGEAAAPPAFVVRKRVPPRSFVLAACVVFATIAASYLTLSPAFGSPVRPRWFGQYGVALDEGVHQIDHADYRGAKDSLDKAFAISKANDGGGSLAGSYRIEGDLAAAQGRLGDAREKFKMALQIRKDFQAYHLLPALYEAIGDVETRMWEFDSARANLMLSLKGYRRYNEGAGIAMAARDLGSVAIQTGQFDEADDWFRKALAAIRNDPEQEPMRVDIRGRQALLLVKLGKAEEAKTMQQACLAFWTAKGHPRWVADCERDLALTEAALGNVRAATVRMRRSKAGFRNVGDQAGVRETDGYLRGFGSKP